MTKQEIIALVDELTLAIRARAPDENVEVIVGKDDAISLRTNRRDVEKNFVLVFSLDDIMTAGNERVIAHFLSGIAGIKAKGKWGWSDPAAASLAESIVDGLRAIAAIARDVLDHPAADAAPTATVKAYDLAARIIALEAAALNPIHDRETTRTKAIMPLLTRHPPTETDPAAPVTSDDRKPFFRGDTVQTGRVSTAAEMVDAYLPEPGDPHHLDDTVFADEPVTSDDQPLALPLSVSARLSLLENDVSHIDNLLMAEVDHGRRIAALEAEVKGIVGPAMAGEALGAEALSEIAEIKARVATLEARNGGES